MGGTNLVNLANLKNFYDKICKIERNCQFDDDIFANLGFRVEICKIAKLGFRVEIFKIRV